MKRYKLIIAKPYLCMAAVLQTIILYLTGRPIEQEDIANYLGVYLPCNFKSTLVKTAHTRKNDKWGIVLRDRSLLKLFKHYSLPLDEEFLPISTFSDWSFDDVIHTVLQEKHASIMCGYDNSLLSNGISGNIGHVSLITGIRKSKIEIIDPGPFNAGTKLVDSYALFKAIHSKHDGLTIIRKINE